MSGCAIYVVGVLFEATEVATEQEPLPSSHEVHHQTLKYSAPSCSTRTVYVNAHQLPGDLLCLLCAVH